MAQESNDKIAWIPAALMSQITVADAVTSGRQTGGPSTPGDYRIFRGTLHSGTASIAVAAALTSGQWDVVPGANDGELTFSFSAYGNLNGGNPVKWQYSLNSGSSWADIPGSAAAAGALGAYTVTGLTGGTVYTSTIKVRLITNVGDGTESADSKSATVTDEAAPNLIANGGFDSGTGWFLSNTSTTAITGGKLVFASAASGNRCTRDGLSLPAGDYDWSFDLGDYTSGSVRIRLRGAGAVLVGATAAQTGNGAKGGVITASAEVLRVDIDCPVSGVSLSVDNFYMGDAS